MAVSASLESKTLDKSLPKGTRSLLVIQLLAVISYAIFYSTLALYCSKGLGLSDKFTTSLVAMFFAFNYGLHLVSGYIGGRFLSYRSLFCIGMVLIAIGCYLISIPNLDTFYIGVAFFLAGGGLNVTCINCMVTQLFHADDKRRETAFFWNYSGMNLGFCIGNIVAGQFQLSNNYRDLFLLSGVGNILALVGVAISWRYLKDIHTHYDAAAKKTPRIFLGLVLITSLVIVLCDMVRFPTASQHFIMYLTFGVFALLLGLSFYEKNTMAKQKMRAYLIFSAAATIFWMITYLIPNALALFVDRNVDRSFLGIVAPPQWFINVNPVIIMSVGPMLGLLFQRLRRKGYRITLTQQFSMALLLIGGGILLIPLGIHFANAQGYVNASWVVVAYALQGLGELFLGPIGFAMVGQLAPVHLRGLMMGAWLMTSGLGGALAGIFSGWATVGSTATISPLVSNTHYSHVLLGLGWIGLIGAGVLFLLRPLLDRLIHEILPA